MKHLFRLVALLALLCLLSTAAWATDTTALLWDGQQYISTVVSTVALEIDGIAIESDQAPFILQDRTLVPIRIISEYLGATVEWDGEAQQVRISMPDTTIVLTIGSSTALVGEEEVPLPDGVAPTLVQVEGGSRTMVPARFVAEQLGAAVEWDGDTRTVCITSAATEETGEETEPESEAETEDTSQSNSDALAEEAEEDEESEATDAEQSTAKFWADLTVDPSTISILLDAGHGGSDPGCQSSTADEKDITLTITLAVGELLEKLGYQVFYTREDDSYVSLADRSDMANDLGVSLFVSIHVNAAEIENAYGIETYYWTWGTDVEAQFAASVQEALIAATGAYDRGVRTANYWVCRNTDMPAILVETGFLTNNAEGALLTTATYQRRLAQAIAAGIDAFAQQLTG